MNIIATFVSITIFATILYWLIKYCCQAFAADRTIRALHDQQAAKNKGQLYPLSPSHLLLMEAIKLQDMELRGELTPMQLNFKKEQWYIKVEEYSHNYFRTLRENQAQKDKLVDFPIPSPRAQNNQPPSD